MASNTVMKTGNAKSPTKGKRRKRATQLSTRILTPKHIHAALLTAHGKLNMEQICEQVEISYEQLKRMKKNPLFLAEVERQTTNFQNRVAGAFLGMREKRVRQRDAIYNALQHIRKCRVEMSLADPELEKQGGKTGLVVLQKKFHKTKHIDTVYSVDHETVDQMRALMKEQAQDVGDLQGDRASVAVTVVLSQEEQAWL